MLEMKRKNEEINSKLEKKAADERRLKEERKENGKQQLEKIKK